jgi:hypothetical protein
MPSSIVTDGWFFSTVSTILRSRGVTSLSFAYFSAAASATLRAVTPMQILGSTRGRCEDVQI